MSFYILDAKVGIFKRFDIYIFNEQDICFVVTHIDRRYNKVEKNLIYNRLKQDVGYVTRIINEKKKQLTKTMLKV